MTKKTFAASAVVMVLAHVVITQVVVAASQAKSPVTLHSARQPGQTDKVEISLEVGGETKHTDDGKPQREKMRVLCELDYVEKTLECPATADAVWRSVREYGKVSADVKVGDGQFKPTLKPEHRLIAVEAAQKSTLLFSPGGNLTRDELDSVDVQINTLLLDRLLPEKPVASGERWTHSADLMAAMLGLDEVAKTTVESTLKEVTPTLARCELTGRIEGAIYGVSTNIEIKARYRFDRRTKRIDWLGMLVKELREGSFVEVGVDVVSRLAIKITPAEEPAGLADAALAKLTLKSTPKLADLHYESLQGDWRCLYDRRWFTRPQQFKNPVTIMRLLDRGMLVGQWNLSSAPRRDPDKLVSLEEFQEDVRRALGKSFGELVEAGQSSNTAGYRVYRVVAHGVSSEIPMRWIYYLVADQQGRQVAFTFTVEQSVVDRFADADKAVVDSVRFVDKKRDG
jgi:hypothetical protein